MWLICNNVIHRIRLHVVWSCMHGVQYLLKAAMEVLQSSCSGSSNCVRTVNLSRMVLAWRSCGKWTQHCISPVALNTRSAGHWCVFLLTFSWIAVLTAYKPNTHYILRLINIFESIKIQL